MATINYVSPNNPQLSSTNASSNAMQQDNEETRASSNSSLPTKPNLLPSINASISPPEIVREELALLREPHKKLPSESTKIEFIWNSFLQIMGIIFVVVFGVFSIIACRIGEQANTQASEANQLALLSLCSGSNSSTIEAFCNGVLQDASQTISPLLHNGLGNPQAGKVSITPITSNFSKSDKIGLGIGILGVTILVSVVMAAMWKEKFGQVRLSSWTRLSASKRLKSVTIREKVLD